jgi:hypothetical protein
VVRLIILGYRNLIDTYPFLDPLKFPSFMNVSSSSVSILRNSIRDSHARFSFLCLKVVIQAELSYEKSGFYNIGLDSAASCPLKSGRAHHTLHWLNGH